MTVQGQRTHPLHALSEEEMLKAADIVRALVKEKFEGKEKGRFKHTTLLEPPKSLLLPYLDSENDDAPASARPFVPRCAQVLYTFPGKPGFTESIVSLDTGTEVKSTLSKPGDHAGFDRFVSLVTVYEKMIDNDRIGTRSSRSTMPFYLIQRSWTLSISWVWIPT